MKAIKPLIILLFTCCQISVSFSQSNKLLSYLPADAKIVIKINLAGLGQKMQWVDFTKTGTFDDMTKELSEEQKSFLK
ncbi:MAG TPA: hypothetical protein VFP87_15685, partial [Chitinophagaceae bacterium]|nr:hypothetical protein [Chitinophagaceae bacterium]